MQMGHSETASRSGSTRRGSGCPPGGQGRRRQSRPGHPHGQFGLAEQVVRPLAAKAFFITMFRLFINQDGCAARRRPLLHAPLPGLLGRGRQGPRQPPYTCHAIEPAAFLLRLSALASGTLGHLMAALWPLTQTSGQVAAAMPQPCPTSDWRGLLGFGQRVYRGLA